MSAEDKKSSSNFLLYTRPDKKSVHFEWEIDHFNLMYDTIKEIVSPPLFPQEDDVEKQWILKIKIVEKEVIGPIFHDEVHYFKIELIRPEGSRDYVDYLICLKSGDQTYDVMKYHGNKKDLSNLVLIDNVVKKLKWLEDDRHMPKKMTIICDICVVKYLQNFQEEDLKHLVENYLQREKLVLKQEEYKDFTFIIKEKKFRVHKLILALESPVFDTMFKTNMIEGSSSTAEINDVEPEAFEKMLNFVYKNHIDEDTLKSSIFDLLHLAHKYEFEKLEDYCTRYLLKELSADNVVEILNAAEKYVILKLKRKALICLKKNLEAIQNSEDFKNLIMEHPSLVMDLIKVEEGSSSNDSYIGETKCTIGLTYVEPPGFGFDEQDKSNVIIYHNI